MLQNTSANQTIPVYNHPGFTINQNGEVFNQLNKQMSPRRGGKQVRINGKDQWIAELLINTFNESARGRTVYDLQFKDGDNTHITMDNITYKLCDVFDHVTNSNHLNPIEFYNELKEDHFYRIPGFERWAINKDAVCITLADGYGNKIKEQYTIGRDPYLNIKFGGKDTSHRVIHVMINTFYPQSIGTVLDQVNYLNGDIKNCKLNNIGFIYHHVVIDSPDKAMYIQKINDPIKLYNKLSPIDYFTIPGFSGYAINRDGQIYSKAHNVFCTNFEQVKANTTLNACIIKDGDSRSSYFSVLRLMVNTFLNNDVTDDNFKRYGFLNCDTTNVSLNNIEVSSMHVQEVLDAKYPGYVQIEDSDYGINIDGDIINAFKGTKMLTHIKDGYVKVNLYGVSVHAIHRLLAIAFLPIPLELEDYPLSILVVHHKDENKLNNTIDPNDLYGPGTNLQWMHKIDHDIHHRNQSIYLDYVPVKVRHIITGKITEHKSIGESSRIYNFNAPSVTFAITQEQTIKKLYQVKYLADSRPWPKYSVYRAYNPNKKLMRDFLTLDDTLEYLKISRAALFNSIKEKRPTRGGWLISRVERS